MTNLPLQCPLCGSMMEIDASMAGMQVTCPTCQGVVQTPPLEEPPAQDPTGAVSLACPLCQGAFQVVPEMAGQQVACPHCEQPVGIPDLWNAPPAGFEREATQADDDGLPVVRGGRGKKRKLNLGNLDDLLPPGADLLPPVLSSPASEPAVEVSFPPMPTAEEPPPNQPLDLAASLLPPGAVASGGLPASVGEQRAISTTPVKRPVRMPTNVEGTVVPTPDGGYTTLQDRPKKVEGVAESSKLSPEEKAARRLRMNIIVYTVCFIILAFAVYLFTKL